MSENFEQKSVKNPSAETMADFGSQFEKPQPDASKWSSTANKLDSLEIKNEDSSGLNSDGARRKDFPHAWLQTANSCYSLPAEAALSSMKPIIEQGWHKLNS